MTNLIASVISLVVSMSITVINKTRFDEYNTYCEACKKEVKLQMIG